MSVPLLLIIGGFTFLLGFFVGWQVVSAALGRRQRQLDTEREIVNAIWQRLDRKVGTGRTAYLIDFLDRTRARHGR